MAESIQKSEAEKALMGFCDAAVKSLGFQIVDVDCNLGGRSLIRLYIDKLEQGAEGSKRLPAGLEDCAHLSRELSPLLDQWEAVPGSYELEVSSAGLDRRLRLKDDFSAVLGEEILIKLVEKQEGIGGQGKGKLLEVTDSGIAIQIDSKTHRVEFSRIRKAHRIWKM